MAAPITLLTALLFYFGWVFTNARALYFGIDPSALGFSAQDYVLRSIDPVFLPLAILLGFSLLLLDAHAGVTRWVGTTKPSRARALSAVITIFGLASLAAGVSGVLRRPLFGVDTLITPLELVLGIGAISYARHLRCTTARLRDPAGFAPALRWVSSTSRVVLAMLVVLMVFWMTHDWAKMVGIGRAQELERTLSSRPGVSVYSRERLQIDAAGVQETRLVGGDSAAYGFRYDGLKLLVRSGGNYFLLSVAWSRGDGPVIVLRDNDRLRLEFLTR